MKYVITGSLGHISKPLVSKLVEAGHQVAVITSNHDRTAQIKALGATALAGSVEDQDFLRSAFQGADAVYTMVPPTLSATDWKKHIEQVGKNYADALRHNKVRYVVNLSSVGAHLSEGCGPVSGLYRVEKALNELPETNVVHLRPGYFYYNFYSQIGMIRNLGFAGGNFGAGAKLIISHTNDISDVAAQLLLELSFKGKSVRYQSSDEVTTDEIAAMLGGAIGKPDLKWVDFTDEQTLGGMLQAGLPNEVASNYTEMGAAIRNGKMFEHYRETNQKPSGKITLKDFSKEFAAAFNQEAVVSH